MAFLPLPLFFPGSKRGNSRRSFRFAGDADQFKRGWNIAFALDPETNPAGVRENVVRQCPATPDQHIAIRAADKTIQQTVAVNVARFLAHITATGCLVRRAQLCTPT